MDIITTPLFLHAWLAGLGVVLAAGPLGCFVAWQRLAYFGDTIAHAALLGVVLGLLMHVDIHASLLFSSVAVAVFLLFLQRGKELAGDTLLGILAHGALALGLVLLALSNQTIDVSGYLFGDILSVGTRDLTLIFTVSTCVLFILFLQWRPLMMMTFHADIAQVEGVRTQRLKLTLTLLIAIVIAVAIKIVGMLLITSLLIIPAASARSISKNPLQMMWSAAFMGVIAVTLGLYASFVWDVPSGPAIILAALLLFIVSLLQKRITA